MVLFWDTDIFVARDVALFSRQRSEPAFQSHYVDDVVILLSRRKPLEPIHMTSLKSQQIDTPFLAPVYSLLGRIPVYLHYRIYFRRAHTLEIGGEWDHSVRRVASSDVSYYIGLKPARKMIEMICYRQV